MRRGIAAGAAAALVLEAVTIGFVNWVLGLAVRHQRMSLGGLDPEAAAVGSWLAGGLFALFLIGCAVVAARMSWRGRPAGRFGRIALAACAVVHGVAGAVVVGLVGWWAFAATTAVLGLLVATLLLFPPRHRHRRPAARTRENPGEAPPAASPTSPAPA